MAKEDYPFEQLWFMEGKGVTDGSKQAATNIRTQPRHNTRNNGVPGAKLIIAAWISESL